MPEQSTHPKWIWEGVKRTQMTDEGRRFAEWLADETEWLTPDELLYVVGEVYPRMSESTSLEAALYDAGPPPPRLVHRARRQGSPWQESHTSSRFDDSPAQQHVGHSALPRVGPGVIPRAHHLESTAPLERAITRAMRAYNADPSPTNRVLARLHLAALDRVLYQRDLRELVDFPCP